MKLRLQGVNEGEYLDIEFLASGCVELRVQGRLLEPPSHNIEDTRGSAEVLIMKKEWDTFREYVK